MSVTSTDVLLRHDQSDIVYNRLVIAGAAVYAYDRVLTAGREVELIWRQGRIGIAVPILLGCMHFSTIFLLVLGIDFMTPPQSCRLLYFVFRRSHQCLFSVSRLRSRFGVANVRSQRQEVHTTFSGPHPLRCPCCGKHSQYIDCNFGSRPSSDKVHGQLEHWNACDAQQYVLRRVSVALRRYGLSTITTS
ncbi:uncharacterized protein B0H18DRAFT_346300 [Fomitopsis serialis]|uniref:uncharacterized protein n=1 Tax=Fomitopsis serialis TaxID=139415 RepID=UPI00200774F8|nr:uncharacterized protein B0H18DRAFT_346300 [Neoantrodia serialis]KAH9911630.1 hypothetical protein B0H18DRAFT_346300 [Neoantrodia serialis]